MLLLQWVLVVGVEQNNQKSHIINILLASFGRSVRKVMDLRIFLLCFHGPRASRWTIKGRKKLSP